MSYFTGDNLKRKIHEYDLEDLNTVLQRISLEGVGGWPGCFAVPAPSALLEPTRIVLYSMLHSFGLKDAFIVKMMPAKGIVTIDLRPSVAATITPPTQVRTGGVHLLGPAIPVDDISGEQENLADLFEEPQT